MSRKGENIRKRKDGRWEGRYKKGYREDGKIIYGSVYGKSYRDVKEKIRIAIAIPASNAEDKKAELIGDMTFIELLDLWQKNNEMRLKGGTQAKYAHLISAHIAPGLGGLRLSELNALTINAFLAEKLQSGRIDGEGGLSPSYVRSISLVISSALSFAVNEELCKPLKNKICKPSIVKKDLSILSVEKQKVLEENLANQPSPTSVGIMLSLYTGMRIGEICALKWSDIDLASETIYVKHTVARVRSSEGGMKTALILDEPKTHSSKRIIPIPSHLMPILCEHKTNSRSSFVVSDKEGFVSPRTYESRYHKILADCSIEDMNYHALRHTFATRCIEAGVDVKSLSEILGHSNVSITLNTYVHSSIEQKKLQLEKLSAFSVF